MKSRKSILLIIILMVVGFAAVSTTLYINGSTKINPNQDDFNVYYSDAYVNGTQDKSVIEDNTHIVFETELSTLGEKYVLDYEVTNGSKNYDAELVMECTGDNEYLTVTNNFDTDTILKSTSRRQGKLTLELIKSNAGEDVEVTIECTISANALERESLGLDNRSEISVEAKDENSTDLNAKAYEINGSEETKLLDALSETDLIESIDDVDALIEVKSDDFDNIAETTFNVSSIAEEGDTVVILHFDEEKQEWEFIAEEIVDANGEVTADFTSYSPVAFVVIEDDGTLKTLCQYEVGKTWEFNYTGSEQTFSVPCDGEYKIEAYGAGSTGTIKGDYYASDGRWNSSAPSATIGQAYNIYGSYAAGNVNVAKKDDLYVYVGKSSDSTGWQGTNKGGAPVTVSITWEGRTISQTSNASAYWSSGATDVRIIKSTAADGWSGEESLKSRIVTAGGGAGLYQSAHCRADWNSNTRTYTRYALDAAPGASEKSNSVLGTGTQGSSSRSSGNYNDGNYYSFNWTTYGAGGGGYYGGTVNNGGTSLVQSYTNTTTGKTYELTETSTSTGKNTGNGKVIITLVEITR